MLKILIKLYTLNTDNMKKYYTHAFFHNKLFTNVKLIAGSNLKLISFADLEFKRSKIYFC